MKNRLTILLIISLFAFEARSQTYLLEQDVNNDTLAPVFGPQRKFEMATYIGLGWMAGKGGYSALDDIHYGRSWQYREGIWLRRKINRHYAVGTYLEYSRESFRLKNHTAPDVRDSIDTKWTKQVNNQIAVGVFNRIYFKSHRLFLDLGAFGGFDVLPRLITEVKPAGAGYEYKKVVYNRPDNMNRLHYGLDARFTFSSVAVYGKYRLSEIYKNTPYDLPKWIMGLVVDLKS